MATLYWLVPLVLKLSGMRRWSLLTVWVVEAMRTIANDATGELVVIATLVPYSTTDGALLMTGRVAVLPSALNR